MRIGLSLYGDIGPPSLQKQKHLMFTRHKKKVHLLQRRLLHFESFVKILLLDQIQKKKFDCSIVIYNSVKKTLKTREACFLPVLLGHQQRMCDRFLVPLELMGQIPA